MKLPEGFAQDADNLSPTAAGSLHYGPKHCHREWPTQLLAEAQSGRPRIQTLTQSKNKKFYREMTSLASTASTNATATASTKPTDKGDEVREQDRFLPIANIRGKN